MPQVQYVCVTQGISVTKNMPAPIKASNLWKGWYKDAKKLIPQIPDVPELVGHTKTLWIVLHHDIDVKWIKFDLRSVDGEKAHLVINRKATSM